MAVSSPARAVPAEIILGRVVEVDPDRWVCRVLCSDPVREFSPVLVSSLFMGSRGEGIHAMPEVGVRVYVAVPSDGTHAFIIGYAFTLDSTSGDGLKAGSLHSGRPYLNPGDIAALSRDHNGIVIRRGGIVEICSTPLARTIYNPHANQVLTVAENWEVETLGGKLSWKNLHRDEDQDGELTARYQHEVRQYVDSPNLSVQLQMGATEGARLELDGPVPEPLLVDTPTQVHLLSAGALAPQPITVSVKRPATTDPAARVIDLRVRDDERSEGADDTLAVGVSRQGAVLLETAAKVRIALDEDTGLCEPVLRGTTFLTALSEAFTEITAGLNSLGILTPRTDAFLAEILTSESTGAPFLSSTLESE